MIAADTSALSFFLRGEIDPAADKLAAALAAGDLILPPVVITEILSDQSSAKLIESIITEIAVLDIKEGYWTALESHVALSGNTVLRRPSPIL